MKNDKIILILASVPDKQTANNLASMLVQERLAACVNIMPEVISYYRWEGKINTDSELLLLIKTQSSKFEPVKEYILKKHPYDLPEIIAIPLTDGFSGYLDWVKKETS